MTPRGELVEALIAHLLREMPECRARFSNGWKKCGRFFQSWKNGRGAAGRRFARGGASRFPACHTARRGRLAPPLKRTIGSPETRGATGSRTSQSRAQGAGKHPCAGGPFRGGGILPRRKPPVRLRFVFTREVRFPNRASAAGERMEGGRDVSRKVRQGRKGGGRLPRRESRIRRRQSLNQPHPALREHRRSRLDRLDRRLPTRPEVAERPPRPPPRPRRPPALPPHHPLPPQNPRPHGHPLHPLEHPPRLNRIPPAIFVLFVAFVASRKFFQSLESFRGRVRERRIGRRRWCGRGGCRGASRGGRHRAG